MRELRLIFFTVVSAVMLLLACNSCCTPGAFGPETHINSADEFIGVWSSSTDVTRDLYIRNNNTGSFQVVPYSLDFAWSRVSKTKIAIYSIADFYGHSYLKQEPAYAELMDNERLKYPAGNTDGLIYRRVSKQP